MFVMGRLTSGVLRLEPDGLDQPVTRTSRGLLGGIVAAVLIGLVMTLIAFLLPGGNDSWKQTGTLVVVKDSGSRYLSVDGVLHPVLNLTSAKLLAGESMNMRSLSAASIRTAPRGAVVGLVGAPDSLPQAEDVDEQFWTACALPGQSGGGPSSTKISLDLGDVPISRTLGPDAGVVVTGSDGGTYLLWEGSRFRIDPAIDRTLLLGADAAGSSAVDAGFLDLIPSGPDLAVPPTAGAGTDGPVLAGEKSRIGELFADSAGHPYLLTQEGLVPLTATLFEVYQADPRTQTAAYGGRPVVVEEVGPGDISEHLAPPSATVDLTHESHLPSSLPEIVALAPGQAVCAREQSGESRTVIRSSVTETKSSSWVGAGIVPSCGSVQYVNVKPGHGALVQATLAGGEAGPSTYLITDTGVKYPIPSADAQSTLGYGSVNPSRMSTAWLNLLSTGPLLDPDAVDTGGEVQKQQRECTNEQKMK